jgi:UDP-N-acetylglucosamine:LPS N-acetylglucosamine transferase
MEPRKLCVCILGLGGGGFHAEAQMLIRSLKRPLELVLVYAGPHGATRKWSSKDVVRRSYFVKAPTHISRSALSEAFGAVSNVFQAFRILRREKPDLVLAVGTSQSIPFAIACKLMGCPLWFVESLTRVKAPCRTALLINRLRLANSYHYWASLSQHLPRSTCMEIS